MNNLINNSYKHFINTLCGKYSNEIQSQKEPYQYANINIYFRLLPWDLFKGISIYSEQSYNHSPWSPYRQSVLRLTMDEELFILDNYKIKNSERIAGGGFKGEFLNLIKKDNLIIRKDCEMIFYKKDNESYMGSLRECKKCIIARDGKATYLVSKVILEKDKFISKDEGYDIETNQKVWGSIHGFLEFDRIKENS